MNSDLMKVDNAIVLNEKVRFEETALILSNDLEYNEWENVGEFLKSANKSIQWWVGDWMAFGEGHYEQKYTQMLDATDYERDTITTCLWVSKAIPPSRRCASVSWNHYRAVASLQSEQMQKYWLDYAEKNKLGYRDLAKAIRGGKEISEALLNPAFSWIKHDQVLKANEGIDAVKTAVNTLLNADVDAAVADYVLKTLIRRIEKIRDDVLDIRGESWLNE